MHELNNNGTTACDIDALFTEIRLEFYQADVAAGLAERGKIWNFGR